MSIYCNRCGQHASTPDECGMCDPECPRFGIRGNAYKAAHEAAKDYHRAQIKKADEMERSGAWIPPVAETHRIEHRQLLAMLEAEDTHRAERAEV